MRKHICLKKINIIQNTDSLLYRVLTLVEANRTLQLEQPELHHEDPTQGIVVTKEGEATAQMEFPPSQPKVEVDLFQLVET
jgi:hypothetical protein